MHRKGLFTIILLLVMTLANIAVSAEEKPTLGLLIGISGLGDQSFNDMTYAGMIKAKQEFDLKLILEDSEKTDTGFERSMQRLVDKGARIIVANGFYMQDLVQKFASRYPDHYFILQDAKLPDLPNVVSIVYSVEEGSFLAGALAGLMTKTGKVGFLGGVDIPIMHLFGEGYRQGALYVNPKVEVSEAFVTKAPDFSGFRQPAAGHRLAMAAYGAGVDILYVAAGLTGNGALQAASDAGRFAIGVDSDQDHLAKGFVLTSMMKRLDIATYGEVAKIIGGTFTPGVKTYGFRQNGIGLSEMKFTRHLIPPAVLDRLEKIKTDIISGTIKVHIDLDSGKTTSTGAGT